MSEEISEPHADSPCGDAPVYLFGMLTPDEAVRFLAHAESCVICRDELAALAPAIDELSASAPQLRAPEGLRRRVSEAVRSEASVASRLSSPRRGRERRGLSWQVHRGLAVGFAACLCALVAGGALSAALFKTSKVATTTRSAQVSIPNATAALHRSGTHLWLTVEHMPSPGKGHVYEVWVKRGEASPQPTSALFEPTRNGEGAVAVPGDLSGVTEVMVTAEPDGGTLTPTSTPVIVGRLS